MRYIFVLLFSVFLSDLSLMSKDVGDSLKHILCTIIENGTCRGSIDSMFFYDGSLNSYVKINDYTINREGFDVNEETYSNMLRADSIILYVKYVDSNYSRKKDLEISVPILFSKLAFKYPMKISLTRDLCSLKRKDKWKMYCLDVGVFFYAWSCSMGFNFTLNSSEIKSGKMSKVLRTNGR